MASSPYRPHNPGHDYYEAGAYLITLVVCEREHILSSLNDDAKQPEVVLSQVGRIVQRCLHVMIGGHDYARFHNLNQLAEQICAYDGAARVLNQPL